MKLVSDVDMHVVVLQLVYRLWLSNGLEACASFFLVYADPVEQEDNGPLSESDAEKCFHWRMVLRSRLDMSGVASVQS